MTRGFVTIATGNEQFYRIATNLLQSYRFFSAAPMPFALICDRENEYSAEFDQTIILEDPDCSYLDKLRLPEYIPYDETIFIDSDCLAYRDLNEFWEAFENAPDFSAFGHNYPIEYPYAWFKREDVGEFADRIQFIPDFIGGVYFLRKSQYLDEFAKTCDYVLRHYYDYRFRQFENPCDEAVIALSMAIHGGGTIGDKSLPVCFYPHCIHFEADISLGLLSYDSCYQKEQGIVTDGRMIHWGSGNTRRPVYLLEEYRLHRLVHGKSAGSIEVCMVKKYITTVYKTKQLARRIRRFIGVRIKRLLG